jgi:hypothetical protein
MNKILFGVLTFGQTNFQPKSSRVSVEAIAAATVGRDGSAPVFICIDDFDDAASFVTNPAEVNSEAIAAWPQFSNENLSNGKMGPILTILNVDLLNKHPSPIFEMDINQKCDYCLPHEGPEKLYRIFTDNHPIRKVDVLRFLMMM